MKLHFEPDLDYQHTAIEAVADLFRGQEINRTEFTVTRRPVADPSGQTALDLGSFTSAQGELGLVENELGIGNRLTLLDDEILDNLKDIQLRNGLAASSSLASGDFTVEMETGTGKTYVYLRTVFELNKRYGFTKFVIVVPSVAIKEGVYKTLKITEDHFKGLYAGQPFDYFLYDSAKLGQVRSFATSPNIQIMVLTVGAINKFGDEAEARGQDARDRPAGNVMYRPHEKTGGERPIDLVRATNPIVIIDEPQSVDGGLTGQGRQAIARLNPLCTLRYSATHVDKHHMVYRLDAVDAYERKLVKQIEVASLEVEEAHNKAYVRFVSSSNARGTITAKIEIDVQDGRSVRRREVTVQDGDDLQEITSRAVYVDCRIGEIRSSRAEQLLELKLPGGETFLSPGQAVGDVDADGLKRLMIRRTIHEHLQKEKRLAPLGIKVLSLFFIDAVEHYRSYDAEGHAIKGKYALMFEEEYRRLAKHPDFSSLFAEVDVESDADAVHDGYFSIDKQRRWTDTAENNQPSRDNAERAYNLIMQDKEKLLSFDTKLKFIFSHSALKEGWDNPNVFQICALREIGTERERRQTIGRGLRLCVNAKTGERARGFEINTLTVMANESYEEFADNLQKEIEKDTGIRFGIVEKHQFATVTIPEADGSVKLLGFEESQAIFAHLLAQGFVDAKGHVQDALRAELKAGTFTLPDPYAAHLGQVRETLRKIAGKLDIKNADERRQVKTRQAILESPEFAALWDRIKHKTTYRVQFDNEKLIADCAKAIASGPPVAKARVRIRKADLSIGQGGIQATEKVKDSGTIVAIEEGDINLPDILTDLQDRTQLTRKSLVRILTESGRLGDFKRNPQSFIELAGEVINRTKRLALVDGIKYQKVGSDAYYAQELFAQEELTGYLRNMLMDASKSVFEHVVYDSGGVERTFAEQLEKNSAVKLYAKLPGWFKVPTPLGTYNPDWALLVEQDGEERLYFVVETKGSLFADDLRDLEAAKIACAEEHFKELAVGTDNAARYVKATKIDDVFDAA